MEICELSLCFQEFFYLMLVEFVIRYVAHELARQVSGMKR
jgi:hypothetical protein